MAHALCTEDLEAICSATLSDWEALRGRTIVVTGATGFVGRWLLESFVYANDRLGLDASCLVLTRAPGRLIEAAPELAAHPAVRLHTGDVRTAEFPRQEWFGVIHAAADSHSRFETDGAEVRDVIVNGTRRMLACAQERTAQKFLFISSGAVYGNALDTHADESYDPSHEASGAVLTPYGQSKREAERACLEAQAPCSPTVARLFAFVGPLLPLDRQFAIGNFIGDGLARRPITIEGDGRAVRSYLYAADMAAWLWTVFFRGASRGIYNIGSDRPIAIADLAARIASLFDPVLPVSVKPVGAQSSSARASYYLPSVARIKTELGVSITTEIDAALKKTIAWHRLPTHERAPAS